MRKHIGRPRNPRVRSASSLALGILWLGAARLVADTPCPAHMFVIERSTNANVVVYDANRGTDGQLVAAEPVIVYWLIDPRREWPTKSDILVHVYAALVRAGMPIPYPRQVIELVRDETGRHRREDYARKRAALESAELFASLTPKEKDAVALELRTAPFVTDDIVFREGENPYAGKRNVLTESQQRKRRRMIRHVRGH